MKIDRSKAILYARETLSILRAGSYRSAAGEIHNIRDAIKNARSNTKDYRPDWIAQPLDTPRFETVTTVENAPTLLVAKRLQTEGYNVAALNFASARNAGGGFLNGARAQEEYLCRNSALFACLELQPFYTFHRSQRGAFYTSSTLYSPDVPVIRNENHQLVAPWQIAFLTAAAPNVGAEPVPLPRLRAAFEERTRKILSIAKENGHDALVLERFSEELMLGFISRMSKPSFGVLSRNPE